VSRRRWARRLRLPSGDDGFAGGFEVLPFAVLVFVIGTLLVVNAWAVVDAKLAVTAAAREAARAYVEAPPATADADARTAADDALRSYGRSPSRLGLGHDDVPVERCQRVVFTATYDQAVITLPLLGGMGPRHTVRSRHSEIVDRFASRPGLDARSACGA
jgi:hypothetical protein